MRIDYEIDDELMYQLDDDIGDVFAVNLTGNIKYGSGYPQLFEDLLWNNDYYQLYSELFNRLNTKLK
jgi:hypothetical protein